MIPATLEAGSRAEGRFEANGSAAESPRLAFVQWRGDIGGAEVLCAALAAEMRQLGVDAQVVFVTAAEPLSERLTALSVPFHALGLTRGRDLLRHPRRFSSVVTSCGPDGAILPECGFIGTALRLGGYRGSIVAVEHGSMLLESSMSSRRRFLRRMSRRTAAWADDIEIGVSDFMVEQMLRGPHAANVRRIYNGVDPSRFHADAPLRSRAAPPRVVIGFAGRLIPGKGADDAIEAIARASTTVPLMLAIAGDGPERPRLAALAGTLGISAQVEFRGVVSDMPGFWQTCDLAVFPSKELEESFGMAAVEAMSCGRPVVATRRGAAPELIVDGVTGKIVAAGDVDALSKAFVSYAEAADLRAAHGAAGRARVMERFRIQTCAQEYLRCLGLGP